MSQEGPKDKTIKSADRLSLMEIARINLAVDRMVGFKIINGEVNDQLSLDSILDHSADLKRRHEMPENFIPGQETIAGKENNTWIGKGNIAGNELAQEEKDALLAAWELKVAQWAYESDPENWDESKGKRIQEFDIEGARQRAMFELVMGGEPVSSAQVDAVFNPVSGGKTLNNREFASVVRTLKALDESDVGLAQANQLLEQIILSLNFDPDGPDPDPGNPNSSHKKLLEDYQRITQYIEGKTASLKKERNPTSAEGRPFAESGGVPELDLELARQAQVEQSTPFSNTNAVNNLPQGGPFRDGTERLYRVIVEGLSTDKQEAASEYAREFAKWPLERQRREWRKVFARASDEEDGGFTDEYRLKAGAIANLRASSFKGERGVDSLYYEVQTTMQLLQSAITQGTTNNMEELKTKIGNANPFLDIAFKVFDVGFPPRPGLEMPENWDDISPELQAFLNDHYQTPEWGRLSKEEIKHFAEFLPSDDERDWVNLSDPDKKLIEDELKGEFFIAEKYGLRPIDYLSRVNAADAVHSLKRFLARLVNPKMYNDDGSFNQSYCRVLHPLTGEEMSDLGDVTEWNLIEQIGMNVFLRENNITDTYDSRIEDDNSERFTEEEIFTSNSHKMMYWVGTHIDRICNGMAIYQQKFKPAWVTDAKVITPFAIRNPNANEYAMEQAATRIPAVNSGFLEEWTLNPNGPYNGWTDPNRHGRAIPLYELLTNEKWIVSADGLKKTDWSRLPNIGGWHYAKMMTNAFSFDADTLAFWGTSPWEALTALSGNREKTVKLFREEKPLYRQRLLAPFIEIALETALRPDPNKTKLPDLLAHPNDAIAITQDLPGGELPGRRAAQHQLEEFWGHLLDLKNAEKKEEIIEEILDGLANMPSDNTRFFTGLLANMGRGALTGARKGLKGGK